MIDHHAMQAANARTEFKHLGGGVVAARVEELRAAGLLYGAHNPLLQEAVQKVQRVANDVARETHAFRARGEFTSEIAAQMTKAQDNALAEFHKFCDHIMALPDHERRVYDGRPYKTRTQIILENNAAERERERVRKAAEQVIVDAVTLAIDTVTKAGGYLTVVTQVQSDMQWGAAISAVSKSVQIVGIDVAALPEPVKATFRNHGERVANEVLARQATALLPAA
jgi:hypothetical protein